MSFKEILICGGKGALDSLKGVYWLYTLDNTQQRAHADRLEFRELRKKKPTTSPTHSNKEEPRLLYRVIQCGTLNGFVFGLSLILFNHLLLPLLQNLLTVLFLGNTGTTFWYWLQLFLHWTFDALWVLPLFSLSRIVNALWFQDIATLAYRYSVGRPKGIQSLSIFIADNLFSFCIQILFLVQAFLCTMLIPLGFVAESLFLLHMCLLYSLYSFEYKWIQMGWPLHQRLAFLEKNWPYFIGFGLPLSLLTWWPTDFLISGCLFAIVFPVFIISANEANVREWNNTKRLKLFSGVVYISNALFKKRK